MTEISQPELDRALTALEAIADILTRIETHLAPLVIDAAMTAPDPMVRIADALDNLAALHAAGNALTGLARQRLPGSYGRVG